jgi:indole-3-glycerol phosphate synthase
MEPLVEVHDESALTRLKAAEPRMILVNARDLRSLAMEPESHARLIGRLPAGVVPVAASGIGSAGAVVRLAHLGYRGFLVGTALMRSPDPGALLRELVGAARGEG